jgi:hypothetical protein
MSTMNNAVPHQLVWMAFRGKKKTGMKFPIEDYNLGPQLQCGSSNGLYRKGGDGFVNDQNKYQHWFFLILPKYSGRSAFVIITNTQD